MKKDDRRHGTEAGHRAHRRAGQKSCTPCRQAFNAACRGRETADPTPLTGGMWQQRGLIQVWVPDVDVMSADEWREIVATRQAAMEALRRPPRPDLTLAEQIDIIRGVTYRLGVDIGDLTERNRTPEVANARHIISWLLRQEGVTFSQIGRLLHRDHATAMYGAKRVDGSAELMSVALAIQAELGDEESAA